MQPHIQHLTCFSLAGQALQLLAQHHPNENCQQLEHGRKMRFLWDLTHGTITSTLAPLPIHRLHLARRSLWLFRRLPCVRSQINLARCSLWIGKGEREEVVDQLPHEASELRFRLHVSAEPDFDTRAAHNAAHGAHSPWAKTSILMIVMCKAWVWNSL